MLIRAAAILALACAVAPAAMARSGKVGYVTPGLAFVDVGSADGVTDGGTLEVSRGKKAKPAPCAVVEVAAHHALCKAEHVEAGDRVTFTPTPPPAPEKAQKPREPVPPPSKLDALRAKLERAPLEKIAFKRPHRAAAPLWTGRGSLTLRQQVWATAGVKDGVYARPSLDASGHAGIGLYPGLYASGALRIEGEAIAPPALRFRPADPLQLYVWDASVGVSEGNIVGAVGRFRPRRAPGMELLDGAQAGITAFGGALEVGAYAGALPDLVTVAPSFDRLTAGAYFGLDLPATKDILILPRARVGFVGVPNAGVLRAEAEVQAQALWVGIGAGGGSVRVGAGGTKDVLPSVDAARVDVDLAPRFGEAEPVRVHGGWRYLAPLAVDYDAALGIPSVGGAHHADVSAAWSPSSWLSLGASGGVGLDMTTSSVRATVGPVVGLPEAFGTLGGLEVGYLEELGYWPGRSAYVSTMLTPLSVVSIVTRASYFEAVAQGDSLREASLMTLVEAPVLPWLSIRGRAQAQAALGPADGSARATPAILLADLGISGSM